MRYNSRFKNSYSERSGFTLIELLVTFTLISIVTGIGFVSFASYGSKQVVVQAAQDLKTSLDLARFDAVSSVKPTGCTSATELSSYIFQFCKNSSIPSSCPVGIDYRIIANCGLSQPVVLSKSLPSGVTFTNTGYGGNGNCGNVTFTRLGSIASGGQCSIRLSKTVSNYADFTINSQGYVSITY